MVPDRGATIIVDNGGATVKVGFAGEQAPRANIPNFVAKAKGQKRPYVGDEVQLCEDIKGLNLRRPIDRGFVVNWDTQKEIWERAFSTHLKANPKDCSLLLTEAPFTLPAIQNQTDEVVFEEFGFRAYCTAPPALLSHISQAQSSPQSLLSRSGISLVVDCGFSFTHALPVVDGQLITEGIRRINLGGKALTNHLKEQVSYRSVNLMDETYLMEDVKEKLCLCSLDVIRDLHLARKKGPKNTFESEYVLPDGIKHKRGFVKSSARAKLAARHMHQLPGGSMALEETISEGEGREEEDDDDDSFNGEEDNEPIALPVGGKRKSQDKSSEETVLSLSNERFMTPEMLFHPSDLGVMQAGLAECIVQSVSACDLDLQPLLYRNILLTGGSTKFPFFPQKLEMELRPLVSDDFEIGLILPNDAIACAWRGGSIFAKSEGFRSRLVSKEEYEESGSQICRDRFMQ